MSQNSIIAFGLIIGFIVFITTRGELPAYLGVFGIGSQPEQPASAAPPAASNPLGSLFPGASPITPPFVPASPSTVSIGQFGLGSGVPGAIL